MLLVRVLTDSRRPAGLVFGHWKSAESAAPQTLAAPTPEVADFDVPLVCTNWSIASSDNPRTRGCQAAQCALQHIGRTAATVFEMRISEVCDSPRKHEDCHELHRKKPVWPWSNSGRVPKAYVPNVLRDYFTSSRLRIASAFSSVTSTSSRRKAATEPYSASISEKAASIYFGSDRINGASSSGGSWLRKA